MDSKEAWPGRPDHTGQDIELVQPGLEVTSHSNLEVASPHKTEFDSPEAVAYHQHGAHDNGWVQPGVPPPPQRRDTVCGVPRNMFCMALAIGVLCVVISVAVGVGVGVSHGNQNDSPTKTTSSQLPLATQTQSFPAATAQATTSSDTTIACPSNNLTRYTSGLASSRSFLLLCGRDFSQKSGATDLYSRVTTTMGECIDTCAQQSGCFAATWGSFEGTFTCFLKSAIGDSDTTPGWYAAVEDGSGSRKLR